MNARVLVALLTLPWTAGRQVDRRAYLGAGLLFAIVKYAGDAALAWWFAGRVWTPWDYLRPLDITGFAAGAAPTPLMPLLALWALPFIWIGVTLSMRRAIDAGWSPWLALGFFGPYLNYGVMAVLALLPTRLPSVASSPLAAGHATRSRAVMAGVSAGLVVGAVLGMAGVALLDSYGVALFLGTPFAVGAVSAVVMLRRRDGHWTDGVSTAVLAITCLAGSCLLLAFEGLICIAMAYPIALVLGVLGAASVPFLVRTPPARPASLAGLLLLPLAAGLEPALAPPPTVHEVRSSIDVAAPADVVWRHVIAFERLPEPTEWLFRLGIAYPIEARIEGDGVGAVRYCVFSTGAFVEPITRWEPGRRLSFDVTASPRPLVELSPYGAIDAPHLDGFLRPRRGEFRLVALPGGGTRLEGSTWYELRMGPEGYWQLYADWIIGRIHVRVLEHIKSGAEG